MASTPVKEIVKKVRPLLSTNRDEAKRRVIKLYKDWCREIQHMIIEYQVPLSHEETAMRIKSEFMKNKDIKDIRVIDMLVLKSYNDLYDIKKRYRFICQFYYKFKENPKPDKTKNFLFKFLSGSD